MSRAKANWAVALLSAALTCWALPASAQSFHTYQSASGSELISTLPGDNVNRVLFSLPIGNIIANDVLVVTNELEMENDGSSTALLTARLILADSDTALTGTTLGVETTQGISVAMFRNKRYKGAIEKFSAALTGTKYVNVIVRANHDLTVRVNRGTLQVMKASMPSVGGG